MALHMAALADQPHGGPEGGRVEETTGSPCRLPAAVAPQGAQAATEITTPSAPDAFATDLPLRPIMSLSLMREGPPNSRMWNASSEST